MARYRLTRSARGDVGSILRTSEERHGRSARLRYSALLLAAMRRVAEEPEGRLTSDRSDVRPGIRSFHIRHSATKAARRRSRILCMCRSTGSSSPALWKSCACCMSVWSRASISGEYLHRRDGNASISTRPTTRAATGICVCVATHSAHSRESGNPERPFNSALQRWVPAEPLLGPAEGWTRVRGRVGDSFSSTV